MARITVALARALLGLLLAVTTIPWWAGAVRRVKVREETRRRSG